MIGELIMSDILLLVCYLMCVILLFILLRRDTMNYKLFLRKVEALEHIEDILDYQHRDKLDKS